MPRAKGESGNGILRYVRERLLGMADSEEGPARVSLPLGDKKVWVPEPRVPLQLSLGGDEHYRLHLEPEILRDVEGRFQRSGAYLLYDPSHFFSSISGFLRLSPGSSMTLGQREPMQPQLLGYPSSVADRHLRLKLTSAGLALKNKAPRRGVSVRPLTDGRSRERLQCWRTRKIEALARLLGAPIAEPSRGAALALLEGVIEVMEREPNRLAAQDGGPGSVLSLPRGPTPILVGDLHARIDNLLVVLTQNGFLEALRDGTGLLILMGDAVHPDVPGHQSEMDRSMLLMDLIFRLKLLFPDRVFYLRGNHDSFADDISKGGVPQGMLWEQSLYDRRGRRYRDAMQRLYDHLPYIAVSPELVCCHAGAPTMKVSREDLIQAHRKPRLQAQLTRLRLRKTSPLSGYGPKDVARLRKLLGVAADSAFIVGHTPLSSDATVWLDAGGIKQHVVLFGAHAEHISVMTRVQGHLLPLTYPVEPLVPVFNRVLSTGRLDH